MEMSILSQKRPFFKVHRILRREIAQNVKENLKARPNFFFDTYVALDTHTTLKK